MEQLLSLLDARIGRNDYNRLTGQEAVPRALPAAPPKPRLITGIHLARARLSPRDRAQLAVDLLDGRAVLTRLTATQVARLCRVSVSAIRGRFRDALRSTLNSSQVADVLEAQFEGTTTKGVAAAAIDELRAQASTIAGLRRELAELREQRP